MASICNDDWASLGVMSGHERKTLTLSVLPWLSDPLQVAACDARLLKLLRAVQHPLHPLAIAVDLTEIADSIHADFPEEHRRRAVRQGGQPLGAVAVRGAERHGRLSSSR